MTTKAPIFGHLSATRTIPPNNIHSVSVSLPTWQDNIDYQEGIPRIVNTLNIGYPRFVVHYRVIQLAKECLKKLGIDTNIYGALPMLTEEATKLCRNFIIKQRTLTYTDTESNSQLVISDHIYTEMCQFGKYNVYITIYPIENRKLAQAFWQNTGNGICSRFADCCLKEVGITDADVPLDCNIDPVEASLEPLVDDYLPADQLDKAKQLIRQRIVDVLHATYNDADDTNAEFTRQHPSALTLNEDSVYLYPGGMNAIFTAHYLLNIMHPERKSVCFGFPYTDTLKILERFGPGCLFHGSVSKEDIDQLEQRLQDPMQERLLAVFCEFPSNPLLHSPNIRRLSALADKYDFPLLVDSTVGGFSNSQLLPFVDVMFVSLTKFFSGDCDVMGGCLIVNTTRSHGARLQHALNVDDGTGRPGYEDTMWWEDAIVLERNCRTFMERDARINHTAEIICDYLRSHPQVADIYYPKYSTKDVYDLHKKPNGGYGGLFSVLLHTPEAAHVFYNTLPCAKGPSLGTNFSLVCPYTLLAHYREQEWAAEFDVPPHLIRMSVGLEEPELIRKWFDTAFDAVSKAEAATTKSE
ncbi:PLP-dependent transferase [Syncephalis fuscata]|nr:PLP-dependent transferase [Syncephalis fuscata]